ncbi:Anaphase-promoting complex, subunit CDC [Parasponia andersonii]|uniref:Anaphase-promoting complex, subunit CDC n=1 Tax=Parasponia andersonii TaxID=3476 RepID=A0A2P5D5G0_PARAD|nr:Anaphase-promoting complex, subunit CDC [Parasponia andersonii]
MAKALIEKGGDTVVEVELLGKFGEQLEGEDGISGIGKDDVLDGDGVSRIGKDEVFDGDGREMLRRKPTKIEVKIEDKDELEASRKRAAEGTTATATSSLLQQLDRATKDASSKAHRIGL